MVERAARAASIQRETRETQISLSLQVDGQGKAEVDTGIGFLDHMLTLFAHHGLFDLIVSCQGDLEIDEHHSAEDIMICLGLALAQSLGDKTGIVRTAHSYVSMDEALARTVVDLSGRPYCVVQWSYQGQKVGQLSTDLIEHMLYVMATQAAMNLHVTVLAGQNDHHKVEAIFKSLARALDQATRLEPRRQGIPSTKGVL